MRNTRLHGRITAVLVTLFLCGSLFTERRTCAADSPVIVTVNGTSISSSDIETAMRSRDIPESLRPTLRNVFAERLIDEQLMKTFLVERKVTATKEQLETAVGRAYAAIRRAGKEPADVLKQRGLDDAAFRRQLALTIAWGIYSRQIVTNKEIRERFQQRRPEYDGTKLRARQIVITLPKDADDAVKQQAIAKLENIRNEIVTGKSSFADAAKKYSTSPSGKSGGDVGVFAYRGTMPVVFTRVAFALKNEEISKPFLTSFGVHLVQVTERKPGQLSLEDVRPVLFTQLAQERWDEIVARLRKTAKIEWKTKR